MVKNTNDVEKNTNQVTKPLNRSEEAIYFTENSGVWQGQRAAKG